MPSDQSHIINRLDFADFAQEFLRRNPAYRKEYRTLADSGELNACAAASTAMARSWGLHFPRSA
jgi:hypothetical protein